MVGGILVSETRSDFESELWRRRLLPSSSSALASTLSTSTSQRLTASSDIDATILPSGENASPMTISQRPSSLSSISPVAASQSKTVCLDADATILLSGENDSPDLQCEGPLSSRSLSPVAASQSKMVSSSDVHA